MQQIAVMKKFIAYLFVILIYGCDKNNLNPEIERGLLLDQTITIEGVARNYHIYIPNNPINAPVVLLFHGNGGDYDAMLGLTGVKAPYRVWLDIALQENVIVIVPNGTLGSNDKRGWNDCRSDAWENPNVDDAAFIDQLLD